MPTEHHKSSREVLRAEEQPDGRVRLEFSDGHAGHFRPPAPVTAGSGGLR